MNVAAACPVCFELVDCECRNDMTSFLRILLQVHERVLTLKATSSTSQIPASACLDKISLNLNGPLMESTWRNRLETSDLTPRMTKLRDRRWYWQFGPESLGIYGRCIRVSDSPAIVNLITRPSAFEKFDTYRNVVGLILGHRTNTSIISRLDVAVDYAHPFDEMLSGFDVTAKRIQIAHQTVSGNTGLTVGGRSHQFVLYDKAAESNLPAPMTRIEARLSGKTLPCKKLDDLPQLMRAGFFGPFKTVKLGTLNWKLPTADMPQTLRTKFAELQALVKHNGLLRARHALNAYRNFDRDYGRFYEHIPWPNNPDKVLNQTITEFFS